jgi:hypothetical protein
LFFSRLSFLLSASSRILDVCAGSPVCKLQWSTLINIRRVIRSRYTIFVLFFFLFELGLK